MVVGLGPGDKEHMSVRALEALKEAQVVVGYKTYIHLIQDLIGEGQEVVSSAMTREVERSRQAVDIALQGKKVAVVSSGDPGVYGMAGVLLEVVYDLGVQEKVDVEVVPGISAANAAASSLGAPLMHDYVVLSLSDLLTPWELILKRIECAAMGDFVVTVYNPKSKKRVEQVKILQEIMLKYKAPNTPVGIVQNAKRGESEVVTVSDLAGFTGEYIDMFSVLIIGNSQTYVQDGKIITPRGYKL
ncbi:MAG: precorrin-3B C(17)-methyltransferase [Clostridia bacterium]|nr:precorrin-3B C(17)-methyltransferase [Clostridia bacterium]